MTKKERKEKEASRRLQILVDKGLLKEVFSNWAMDRQIYFSEFNGFGGALYYIDGAPDVVLNKIKEIENKGDVVYHVTHEKFEFGECWDLFVITEEDVDGSAYGKVMREDFDEYGIQFAYVVNTDIPEFSEYGSIQIETRAGGLIRIA